MAAVRRKEGGGEGRVQPVDTRVVEFVDSPSSEEAQNLSGRGEAW